MGFSKIIGIFCTENQRVDKSSKSKEQSKVGHVMSSCICLTNNLTMVPPSRSITNSMCLFAIIVFFFDFVNPSPMKNGSTWWSNTWLSKHTLSILLVTLLIFRCKPFCPIWLCLKTFPSNLVCSRSLWIDLG